MKSLFWVVAALLWCVPAFAQCPPGLSMTTVPSCEVGSITPYGAGPSNDSVTNCFYFQVVDSKNVYVVIPSLPGGFADANSNVMMQQLNMISAHDAVRAYISASNATGTCALPGTTVKILGDIPPGS